MFCKIGDLAFALYITSETHCFTHQSSSRPPYNHKHIPTMKAFACIVLLAAAALAAPEGKRDKRGFLHSDYHGWDHHHGFSAYELEHAPIIHSEPIVHHHEPIIHHHAPSHRLVSINKVVEVPKIIEIKKIVSVPKVVSVPKIVKVHKIVEEPAHISYSHAPISHGHGWW
ncbi:hypothetical protein O0L34_g13823 [Tuta absoluta]|nr:hypothetical protein O0L34_g13823 [Tuta absoluta]